MGKAKQTALFETHQELGAKIIDFAGYEMPVQYSSIKEEHLAVRNAVGLFDVSHMGEFFVSGPKAKDFIQYLTSNNVEKLSPGKAQYSCLPNEQSGIVDDLLVYQLEENRYMLVVNAANIEKDYQWIQKHNTYSTDEVLLENQSDDWSLLALQGPKALEVLQLFTEEKLNAIPFYTFKETELEGVGEVIVSATGYTGAGGFELYLKNDKVKVLWDLLLQKGEPFGIKPVGLAARDTLRLEKGFCLYGNDITDETSPLEAGLGWITKFNAPFVNHDGLKIQKEKGLSRKLYGFEIFERGIPRSGYPIYVKEEKVGFVTSGTMSPMLGHGIGMGYLPLEYAKDGVDILIEIRGKRIPAVTKKPPFV